jgi:hypothetical protein
MIGDGYTTVLHCEFAEDEDQIMESEPDAPPIYCGMKEEAPSGDGVDRPAACPSHPPYVGIIEGIGGFNSAVFVWDDEMQGYDIAQTGFNNTSLGSGSKKGAIIEAKIWAKDEELQYRGPEP